MQREKNDSHYSKLSLKNEGNLNLSSRAQMVKMAEKFVIGLIN